jgi:hypothetical protein
MHPFLLNILFLRCDNIESALHVPVPNRPKMKLMVRMSSLVERLQVKTSTALKQTGDTNAFASGHVYRGSDTMARLYQPIGEEKFGMKTVGEVMRPLVPEWSNS